MNDKHDWLIMVNPDQTEWSMITKKGLEQSPFLKTDVDGQKMTIIGTVNDMTHEEAKTVYLAIQNVYWNRET